MNVVVIGGGPAGMMAAITAADRGKNVILIEKNDRLGRKMYIAGKGRCNITNDTDVKGLLSEVISNPKFLTSAAYAFPPSATVDFFESRGVRLKTERGARVFPVSDKSADIIDCMVRALKSSKVMIKTSETVLRILQKGGTVVGVITDKNTYEANAVIVATGGLSYPKTGSTGDGYDFAKAVGHSIVEPKPALAPIVLKGAYDASGRLINKEDMPFPQGLSLKNVEAKILSVTGGVVGKEFGEMLFTDDGVSGPAVLTLSSKINRSDFSQIVFAIDFKPALDEKTLDNRLLRDFESVSNKRFRNSLDELLPKSLIPYIVRLTGIDPDKSINSVSRAERKNLLTLLKGTRFAVEGLASIDEAIVTAGGIAAGEINPATMQSKIIPNLYFAGEVIDVDALTGGFNIQIALSTGYLAGNKV